jgi:hypothetical protein
MGRIERILNGKWDIAFKSTMKKLGSVAAQSMGGRSVAGGSEDLEKPVGKDYLAKK